MQKIFLLLITFLTFSDVSFAREYCDWHTSPWGHMGYFGFGEMIMWIIFLIVIGVAVYLIVQAAKSKGLESPFRETPMEILKKRYAKGEITKEEFEKIKKDLES